MTQQEAQVELMRKILSSIDIEEAAKYAEMELTDKEARKIAGDALVFYRSNFHKVIKGMMFLQMKMIAEQAEPEVLPFSRGTINGLYLIQEWFERKIRIAKGEDDKQDKREPGEAISPVGKL